MTKNTTKKERFFDQNLKRLAKKANRRMRELESKGYMSPAYKGVQARLEMMGKKPTITIKSKSEDIPDKHYGRRFSESGKFTNQNDLRQQLAEINRFLNARTSTRTGYEEYRAEIYESADEIYNLSKHGIDQDAYEQIFDELPDDKKDRMYYAEYYLSVTEAYQVKFKEQIEHIQNATNRSEAQKQAEIEVLNENKVDIAEIVQIMENSADYKTALNRLGLRIKDVSKIQKLWKNK